MVPQRDPCPNPRTFEYVTLHDNKDFLDVIRDFEMIYPYETKDLVL